MNQKERTDYKRAFNERAYDRLAITVPKGRKETVEAFAKANGETVNGMTNRLYRAELGLSEIEWKDSANNDE